LYSALISLGANSLSSEPRLKDFFFLQQEEKEITRRKETGICDTFLWLRSRSISGADQASFLNRACSLPDRRLFPKVQSCCWLETIEISKRVAPRSRTHGADSYIPVLGQLPLRHLFRRRFHRPPIRTIVHYERRNCNGSLSCAPRQALVLVRALGPSPSRFSIYLALSA
jgi:hypothetical protein